MGLRAIALVSNQPESAIPEDKPRRGGVLTRGGLLKSANVNGFMRGTGEVTGAGSCQGVHPYNDELLSSRWWRWSHESTAWRDCGEAGRLPEISSSRLTHWSLPLLTIDRVQRWGQVTR